MAYDEVVATCKRYDKAMDLQRSITSGEQVHYNTVTNPADRVDCSYPKCRKAGHTQADCWKKKRDQQTAQLKIAGRSKSFRDETWKKAVNKSGKQRPGDSSYTGATIVERKITGLVIAVTENSSKVVQNITRELRRKINSSHQRETKLTGTDI